VYGDLLRSVRGCVFFGVPHRGADTAYWANFGTNVIKAALFVRVHANFIAALRQNSKAFADISQQFVERGASLRIRTFYETEMLDNQLVRRLSTLVYGWLAMRLLNLSPLQIVDRTSTCLGLVNEIAVGIAGADHSTMCKFDDINSQKYSQVWRAIKGLSDAAITSSASCKYILSLNTYF